MSSQSPFNSLQMPAELAYELFAVFFRFEFALKELGYLFYDLASASRGYMGTLILVDV
jgi:hypothetical protein